MAKLEGILKFTGAIGDLVAYQLNGQWIIRKKSAVSKARIKNDPNFKGTRDSNQEFGGASTIAKQLRHSWNSLLIKDKDNTLHHRLNSVILKMIQAGDGERGQRSFNWDEAKTDFAPINLNNAINPSSYLSQTPDVIVLNNAINIETNNASLIVFPKGTTHYKVGIQFDLLNKYSYDNLKNSYVPETANHETHIIESVILQTNESMNQFSTVITEHMGIWSMVLYIIFYREVNGEYLNLSECPCAWQSICSEE